MAGMKEVMECAWEGGDDLATYPGGAAARAFEGKGEDTRMTCMMILRTLSKPEAEDASMGGCRPTINVFASHQITPRWSRERESERDPGGPAGRER